jgi:RNA polymerase sigma-32 factor
MHKQRMPGATIELALCQRWRDHHDISAARQLMGSARSLVVNIAMGYRAYGLATDELIGEGHVGLMHALCQFDPDSGVRFDTYAMWWIHATILQYILRNASLVTLGKIASRKQLLLRLRQLNYSIDAENDGRETGSADPEETVSEVIPVLRAGASSDARLPLGCRVSPWRGSAYTKSECCL